MLWRWRAAVRERREEQGSFFTADSGSVLVAPDARGRPIDSVLRRLWVEGYQRLSAAEMTGRTYTTKARC
jgi:hypothetical protein